MRKRYEGRGYLTSTTLVSAHSCTFSAYDEGRLSGTVTLRLDSEDGLAADELYGDETRALREQGHKICEFTRLAVDTAHISYPVLAALFHTVFLFAQKLRGFDYAVIEVNPRHVGYYRRALGFEAIGGRRHNTRVNAPAVLMGVSFDVIASKLEHHAGKGARGGHGAQPLRVRLLARRSGGDPSAACGCSRRVERARRIGRRRIESSGR